MMTFRTLPSYQAMSTGDVNKRRHKTTPKALRLAYPGRLVARPLAPAQGAEADQHAADAHQHEGAGLGNRRRIGDRNKFLHAAGTPGSSTRASERRAAGARFGVDRNRVVREKARKIDAG